jgi:photosystem II stability/assembly factor-like uncharacterized protein
MLRRSRAHPRRAALASIGALGLVTALPCVVPAVTVRDNLYAVKSLGADEAWAVGNFGSIYYTRDGGKSWDARESGTKSPLFGIDFADGQNGWIVGKSALILHTTDSGKTWKPQKSAIPPDKHLFAVRALDTRTAWAVGDWGAIAVTHDGGDTWQDRSLGTATVKVEESPGRTTTTLTDDVILYAISFPDAKHGFIVGEFGTLLATNDGGETWEKRDLGTEKTLFSVSFVTPEKGWVVGIDGLLLRTRDGGKTWDVQRGREGAESIEELGFMETIRNPGLYDVHVRGQYGVVVGDTGILLISTDEGESWTRYDLPEKQRLVWMRGVSLGPEDGVVVGANGFSAQIDHGRVVLPGGGSATVSAN